MKLVDQNGAIHFGGRELLITANYDNHFDNCFMIINGDVSFTFPTIDQLNLPKQTKAAVKADFSISDFEKHLLALQKAQEDAFPEEVKQLNRDLAQSNLAAQNMWLNLVHNGGLIKSWPRVIFNKIHVKTCVTDKIHFYVCYNWEPLEHYDTFTQVINAVN